MGAWTDRAFYTWLPPIWCCHGPQATSQGVSQHDSGRDFQHKTFLAEEEVSSALVLSDHPPPW